MKHAMIDIETLGVFYDCAVLTVGGVKFNPLNQDEPFEPILLKLDAEEQVQRGRIINQSTMEWWATQSEEAKKEAFSTNDRVAVTAALCKLNAWADDCIKVWCQGPAFDMAVLSSLYRDYDMEESWKFWNVRDSRTISALIKGDFKKKLDFASHTAVDDCIAQAKTVQEAFRVNNLQFII